MRSQVLLLEAVAVFALVVFVLLLFVPLHVDSSYVVKEVREKDVEQVKRLLEYSPLG